MIIHTLGNEQTDSYVAASQYLSRQANPGRIVLHPSFEELYQTAENYPHELMIVPAAFQSKHGASWGTMHYQNIDKLELIDCFITQLAPMVIAKRKYESTIAYTHAATADLLKRNIPDNVVIRKEASKYLAYRAFWKNGQYVLTSKKFFSPTDQVQIIKEIKVKMLWSVYRIGGTNQ